MCVGELQTDTRFRATHQGTCRKVAFRMCGSVQLQAQAAIPTSLLSYSCVE